MSRYVHIKGYTKPEGKYYCCGCNNWLDELNTEQECMGEFWGVPAYDTFYYCPICGSDEILDKDEILLDEDEEELVDEMS